MKKALKWFGILFTLSVLIILTIGLYFYLKYDKEKIASLLEESLSRKVFIGELNLNIFSAVKGIDVKNIELSNYMLPQQRKLQQYPLAPNHLFLKAESGRLYFSFLPLLSRQMILKKISLQKPVISFIRYKKDSYNISDLMKEGDTSYFKRISIKSLSITKGKILIHDMLTGNRYELYNIDYYSSLRSLDDSGSHHNARTICGFRSQHLKKNSFAQDFDFFMESKGSISNLFDTDNFDTKFNVRIHTPSGKITGFKIFQMMKSLPVIQDYLGELKMLGEEINWKEGDLLLQYKNDTIHFSDGEMKARGYSLKYSGSYAIETEKIDVNTHLSIPKSISEKLEERLRTNIEDILPARLSTKSLVNELSQKLMIPMLNDRGQITLSYHITGTPNHPMVTLVEPNLISFSKALTELLRKKAVQSGQNFLEKLIRDRLIN